MLQPRLTNCTECTTISALLSDIDCKIASLAKTMYGNVVFSLNTPVSSLNFIDLLHYKRILTYRVCNPDYAGTYTLEQIASKVKLLKYK